jgi:hypothetical protein
VPVARSRQTGYNGPMSEGRDEPLIPVHVPALVQMLILKEREKGSPLTRDEVNEIRDNGGCIMLPQSEALKLAEGRGHQDIDPDNAWDQWQAVRENLRLD